MMFPWQQIVCDSDNERKIFVRTLGTVWQCTSPGWSHISLDWSDQRTRMFRFCVQITDLRSGNYWAFFYQEAAADCLQNIRKLALACEKFRYQHLKSWWVKIRALFCFEWSYCWTFCFLYLWILLTLLFVQNKPFLMVSVVEIYHHKTYGPAH